MKAEVEFGPRQEGIGMAAKLARKAEIVSVLRSRGLTARADWLQRELPEVVDIVHNRSLMSTLGIEPRTLTEADVVASAADH
jgi:hypothetical protein